MGRDGSGLWGIEADYDPVLRGLEGYAIGERDGLGRPIAFSERVERAPQPGGEVQLTVDRYMQAIAEEPRLMPHLHLSLQSGDDIVLKRMRRRHLRTDAVRFCEEVRRLRPDIVFGADLIAGFPTETEAMFANTLGLVDDCGLAFLHVFPFSRRPGTPAARMPGMSARNTWLRTGCGVTGPSFMSLAVSSARQ